MDKTGECRVLIEGGEGEITVKKSRFIATVRAVETQEEAFAFADEMRKKYWEANHHCLAFVLGRRGETVRCSDDGEPAGTAGRPMLDVLLSEGIRNAAAVVTRYFGGTLLGTGGLVRAYSQAVKTALENAVVGVECIGEEIHAQTDYAGAGKLQYLLGQRGIRPIYSEYGENVKFTLAVRAEDSGELYRAAMDAVGGRLKWEKIKDIRFIDKEDGKK